MNYSTRYGLQPADRLIEPIFKTGLSQHHAIYLGVDRQGIEWVAENYKFQGVRKIKASEYFTTEKHFHTQPFQGSYQQRIEAVKRALSKMGEPYDLIKFNCEHYAEYVQTGRAASKQVMLIKEGLQIAATVLLFVGIVKLVSNN